MPRDYAYSDIRLSEEIDAVPIGGDISFTSPTTNEAILGYIKSIIIDKRYDWIFLPEGANLEEFKGEQNVKEIAEEIKVRLVTRITESRIVDPADLSIGYIPIEKDKLFFRVSLKTELQDEALQFLLNLDSFDSYIEVL